MTIIGEYNREGFRILNTDTGGCLFVRGNSPFHEYEVLNRWNRYALPIRTLQLQCEFKAQQIAVEHKAIFGGIERVEDE